MGLEIYFNLFFMGISGGIKSPCPNKIKISPEKSKNYCNKQHNKQDIIEKPRLERTLF